MRWAQGSNLLGIAPTGFQDPRITVLPAHLVEMDFVLAEDEGVEPTGRLRDMV